MKRLIITLVVAALLLCSCTSSPKSEGNTAQDTTAAVSGSSKDLPDGDYTDTGAGSIYIKTAAGTSEGGAVPSLSVAKGTSMTQIELRTEGLSAGSNSYIYIDGMLNTDQQLGNSQLTLTLTGDALAPGEHTVAVVQYDGDAPGGTITTYKSTSYAVSEK